MFENRLHKKFGQLTILHEEKLHAVYRLHSIVRIVQCGRYGMDMKFCWETAMWKAEESERITLR
jgi:hypothetical protein